MTSPGDVIIGSAKWCVVNGDNRDIIRTLPYLSIDHCITDPPYEVEAHTKARRSLKDATQRKGAINKGDTRRIDAPLEMDFSSITSEERDEISSEISRITRRWVVAFCQIEAIALWRASMESAGLNWVRGGIWRKLNGAPQFTGDRPGHGFECLAIGHRPGRKRWNGGGRHAVWDCPLDHHAGGGGKSDHPTMKPLALMIQLINDFTEPGEIIFDPYCGSGTTLAASIITGRRCIGIEMNKKYAELAIERVSAAEQFSSTKASRSGQLTLFGAAE